MRRWARGLPAAGPRDPRLHGLLLVVALLATTSGALARPPKAGWVPANLRPPSLPPTLPRIPVEEIGAAAAVLMDAETGEILYQRNATERRAPASLTKILTALLVLERGRLRDVVTVGENAAGVGGFGLGLRRAQRVTLGDLLAAILIRSANDAAIAAAEWIGGSEGGFVALMNARARELGMQDSHFTNAHGLDGPDHYSTAYDLAILTRAALQYPLFARLVRAREATVTLGGSRWGRTPRRRLLRTHNRLLGRFEGADGVKTGYTEQAGRCLVASASRGDRRFVAVLLNDPQRWADAATLLDLAFEWSAERDRARGAIPAAALGRGQRI